MFFSFLFTVYIKVVLGNIEVAKIKGIKLVDLRQEIYPLELLEKHGGATFVDSRHNFYLFSRYI